VRPLARSHTTTTAARARKKPAAGEDGDCDEGAHAEEQLLKEGPLLVFLCHADEK